MKNETYDNYLNVVSEGLNVSANNIEANCITSKNNKFSMDCEGNLTVNTLTINDANSNPLSWDAIFNRIYPVGAIFISVTDVNPGVLFTGVWEKIEGQFLLGSSSLYPVMSTGGEATHKLTPDEMPIHAHELNVYESGWTNTVPSYIDTAQYGKWTKTGVRSSGYPVKRAGGGQPHNNLPPYLAVHIWKRTS